MPARARVDWEKIRQELLSGWTAREVGARHGVSGQTIRDKASQEKWRVTESKLAVLREHGEEKAQEIELAVDAIGSRLRGSSIRTRVKMAEQVEKLLGEIEGSEEMGAVMKGRLLSSLAVVAEKVHRWSSEPTAAEMEGMKTAAINLTLIRTTPEQLRRMTQAKKAQEAREASGRVVEEAGPGSSVAVVGGMRVKAELVGPEPVRVGTSEADDNADPDEAARREQRPWWEEARARKRESHAASRGGHGASR
jgi:hypothetical protein